MKKKGVSPVIATILLIALVVIIGLIIFTWFKSLTQEAVTKFDNENIKLVCERVSFDASYSNGDLIISNLGNVPIWDFDVKIEEPGSFFTESISSLSIDWPKTGLNQGGIFSEDVPIGNADKITLIPILRGVTDEGIEKTEVCDERHGKEIFIV